MANPLSNKKKIRGWKRRTKQIEQWKLRHIDLDMESLFRNNRVYLKLWIDPFYRLTRRNPPVWFSRSLLEAMLEVYQSWSKQMLERDEPFYLKIWLFHPNFIESQIVIAIRECVAFYDHTFDKSYANKAFPAQLFGRIHGLDHFKWELAIESADYCLSDLQKDLILGYRTEKEIAAIKSRAYLTETVKLSAGEDTIYKVKVGDVWLGEIRR